MVLGKKTLKIFFSNMLANLGHVRKPRTCPQTSDMSAKSRILTPARSFVVFRATVISSILYSGDGWARRALSLNQFKKTNLILNLNQVQIFKHWFKKCFFLDLFCCPFSLFVLLTLCIKVAEDSINGSEHFSYDQFYVLYIKFLTLDTNKDNLLGKQG